MKAAILSIFVSISFGCLAQTEDVDSHEAAIGAALVVNECSVGTGGYIELFNATAASIDLAADPASCWYVDDQAGGGAPKRITDAVVSHPAGSTTCASAGRSATCGLVGAGERVWVSYSYVNRTSPDECRLVVAPLAGGVCGAQSDAGVGGATNGTVLGQCFGRQPDGSEWQAGVLECTPSGASNGCAVGAACDDADVCTTGETLQADCSCGGGTATSCDDGDACTADSCDAATGCAHAPIECGPPAGDATITDGAETRILLRGRIVGPDGPYAGEVLVDGNQIVCAAASCAAEPAAAGATVVDTHGTIFPGLVDAHNHGLFNAFDASDWTPAKLYTNHNQWTNEVRYKQLVDAKQWLTGEDVASDVDVRCEMDKYGEIKALVSGTTSMLVAPGTTRACFASVVRSIDVPQNDLPADRIQTSISVPSSSTAQSVCNNIAAGTTDAYVVHVAEGIDATAKNELATLASRAGGCLLAPETTIVHGTALDAADFETLAAHGMSLVWSPQSNDFLYGATARIDLAIAAGVETIALAPDWAIGGGVNLLEELRFAADVDDAEWGLLDSHRLVDMVTIDAARALGLDATIGSIEVGKRADLVVVAGDAGDAYDALLAATPGTVRMVLVDGRVLYGDANLEVAGPADPGCEAATIDGAAKFLCIAETSPLNQLDQTFEEIQTALVGAFADYDAAFLTPETAFSPIAPLVP